MPFKAHGRQYDLVIHGATGYTGLMTAEHVAAKLPADLKWAVAGRSADKLKEVVSKCKALNADRIQPEIEVANVNDEELLALAKKTFFLINVVGPFSVYGEHVVKACAEAGTHYIDCTGEVPWTHKMIKKYNAAARASGAIMIPQSGLESGPSDLLTWSMAQLIKSKLSAQVGDAVVSVHEMTNNVSSSMPSGGTLTSLLGIPDHHSSEDINEASRPYALSPIENPRALARPSLWSRLSGIHRVGPLGLLTTSLTGQWNAAVVFRTWGLLQAEDSQQQQQAYGPNFTYQEFDHAKGYLSGIATHCAVSMGNALIPVRPIRNLIRKLSYQPGQGPDTEKAKEEYIELRGLATPDPRPGNGQQAFGRAYFHGSMYYMTATLLSQAALTVLEVDLQPKGGLYTPACLGQGYIDRLGKAGFHVESKITGG